MIENTDGRWEVIGITSFGKSWYVHNHMLTMKASVRHCSSSGKPNTPGIYTRVSVYNSFIQSAISLSKQTPYYSCACRVEHFSLVGFLIVFASFCTYDQ
jgi:secreted trypsin-like serine protease